MISHIQEVLRLYFSHHTIVGPVAFVILRVLSVVVAPIPGAVLDIAAIAAFGVTRAFLLSETGIMLGAAVAFVIARRHREQLFAFLERKKPNALLRLTNWEAKLHNVGGLWGWVAVRLPTDIAYDWICYAAGLTRVTWRTFMVSTFIGSLPAMIVFFYFAKVALAGGIVRGIAIVVALTIAALLFAHANE